jgi:RimJ/RimL family protein N-acetyltransferase
MDDDKKTNLRSTRRVGLRRARRSDAAEMVALALASRQLHRPWVQPPTTVAAYLAWLQKRRPPRHPPENEASRTLVQRAGFEKEGYSPRYLKISGRWRDHERWAVRSDA